MAEKWGGGGVSYQMCSLQESHRKNNIRSKDILKHELCYKKAKSSLLNTLTLQRPATPLILPTSFNYIVFNTV